MTALRLDLAPETLSALVDLAAPGAPRDRPGSVRLPPAGRLSVSEIARLASLGVLVQPRDDGAALAPVFVAAAGVLLAPRTELALRLWSRAAELTTRVLFPASPAGGGGVSLTPAGASYRLATPVTREDVLALARAGFLAAVGPAAAQTFQALLDPAVATAFFGILDWIRAGGGSRVEAPDGTARLAVDPEAVRRHVAARLALGSPRCFAPYLALVLGRRVRLDARAMAAAFRKLAVAGALEVDGERHHLLGALAVLGSPRAVIEAALQWQERTWDGGSEPRVASRVVLALGGRLLLALDATEDGVLVTTPGPGEVAAWLAAAAGETPGGAVTGHAFCTGCGVGLRPDVRFCTACGRALG